MTYNEAVDRFLEEINRKMYSDNTYRTYEIALYQYGKFCEDNKFDWKKKDTARKFVSYLVKGGYSPNSINLKVSALSSFAEFCVDNEWLDKNMFVAMKVKAPKRLINYIPDETVDLLLSTIDDKYRPYIELMLYGGLRISEAVSVDSKNLYFDDSILFCRVIGKGDKERITPILAPEEVKQRLSKFRKDEKITEGAIKEYLYRWSLKHGKHITAHMLRHTFATRAVQAGIPIEVVSKWLGHENLQTTMVYVTVTYERVKHYAKAVI